MSEGLNLNIETTALATIAWLNDPTTYSANIESAIEYLVSII